MRCILFLLLAALVVPGAAADHDEDEDDASASESSEQSGDGTNPLVAMGQTTLGGVQATATSTTSGAQGELEEKQCQVYDWNGYSFYRPLTSWFTLDPDGCYRRLIDQLVPP